jgi:hypothetical protein
LPDAVEGDPAQGGGGFRTAKSLLETRPIYHKLDETIRGTSPAAAAKRVFIHSISADDVMKKLGVSTKLNAD